MSKAVFAFSADPITFGHIDIIKRALTMFDEVIIAIGNNTEKTYLFPTEKRIEMTIDALATIGHVNQYPYTNTVKTYEGLLIDFAYEQKANVIVRGVRNAADFDYEKRMALCGESQDLDIETVLLMSNQKYEHVSSGSVKSLLKSGGFIHKMVPLNVKYNLEKELLKQYIIGVTGEMGSGKSFVTKKLIEKIESKGYEVHHLDLDKIAHEVLKDLKQPAYVNVRKMLISTFGLVHQCNDDYIDRAEIGKIIFADKNDMETFNSIMLKPMLTRIKKELFGKKGIILFNSALLAEADWNLICNNFVILINTTKELQLKRLLNRGLDEDQIKERLDNQLSFEDKYNKIYSDITKHNQGKTFVFENTLDDLEPELERVTTEVISSIINTENYDAYYQEVNGLL
jgi:pantetheine-phosphate adenylyltransferase